MLKYDLKDTDFDLYKVLKYKPFFFFWKNEPTTSVVHNLTVIDLFFSQKEGVLRVELKSKSDFRKYVKEIKARIEYILGLYESYDDFMHYVKEDRVLGSFKDKIEGNRIVSAYNDFDALFAIVVSQNMSFVQYKKVMMNIFDYFGHIPSPFEVLKYKDKFKDFGIGYRDVFLKNIAEKFRFFKSIEYEDLNVKGIGNYSRNIYVLFQKRKWDYFYVDTLIKRIFKERYGFEGKKDKEVKDFAIRRFGPYSGLAEVYLQKFLNDN